MSEGNGAAMTEGNDPRAVRFEAEGVAGTVRPLRSGRDTMFRALVYRKTVNGLRARDDEWSEIADRSIVADYADAVIVTTALEGHTLPGVSASADEHAAGFEAWSGLSLETLGVWINAIKKASAPPNDEALLPPALISSEKKASSRRRAQNKDGA